MRSNTPRRCSWPDDSREGSMIRSLIVLTNCLLICVVQAASPPRPVESDWLATESGQFSIAGDPRGLEGAVRYEMLFRVRKPVTERLFMTVDFENPVDK